MRLWPQRGQRELESQRYFEGFEDKPISEQEMHRINDDMCLPGDPPYFDCCDAIPCNIVHLSPRTITGPIERGEWAGGEA